MFCLKYLHLVRIFLLISVGYSHSGVYEEFCHLGHNAVWSVESQPTFRRNVLSSSYWLKSKRSRNP
jgi:hypothetical protein